MSICQEGGRKMAQTIKEIKEILERIEYEKLPEILNNFHTDERTGVAKLVEQYEKKYKKYQTELKRLDKMLLYERKYASYHAICGIDEAGRGPLAGPVVAGAVILPEGWKVLYLNDSKQLSEKMREELYEEIMEHAIAVGTGIVDAKRIDEINILQATYEAMRIAIQKLSVSPDILLNDAVTIPKVTIKQVPIIKGDASSLSIAAASIIAKVTRDRMMKMYDTLYPDYGFAKHKGYGCEAHIEAIKKKGASPIHRTSFLKNFIVNEPC